MISATLVGLFDVVVLLVVARRAREILDLWPLDASVMRAAVRHGARGVDAVADEGGAAPLAELARAIRDAEPGERTIAIEDAVATVRERVIGRLSWLRVMAPAASGLGLAGAAVQAGWARHPPGLLALDPDRVMGIAASAGATCLALGIAGSTTALGALYFLRRRALAILADVDRLAAQGRALPTDAWTPPAR